MKLFIVENYQAILDLWDGSDTRARINGIASHMVKFEYFFGVSLLYMILRHTDNLSKSLQSGSMSASHAQKIAAMTVKTLQVRL